MFKRACPECGCDLVACPGDLVADEVFLCEECDTRWAVCPDCGELTDADENWDMEQQVCDGCAITDNEQGIQMFVLPDDTEKAHEFFKKLFGN